VRSCIRIFHVQNFSFQFFNLIETVKKEKTARIHSTSYSVPHNQKRSEGEHSPLQSRGRPLDSREAGACSPGWPYGALESVSRRVVGGGLRCRCCACMEPRRVGWGYCCIGPLVARRPHLRSVSRLPCDLRTSSAADELTRFRLTR
jgi:hypothetical protein